jgi:uncharacterized membrane protein
MTDATVPKPRTKLWIKIVLALSIVLNLGLAGIVLGLATGRARDGSVMSAAFAALPSDLRGDLRRDLRGDWRDLRGRGHSTALRAEVLRILQTEPFDAAAFDAALGQGRPDMAELGQRQRARLTASVAAMNPDQRRAYADALAQRLDRRGPPRP